MKLKSRNLKPKKIDCEICKESNKSVLHYHHIVERTDPNCTDDWGNVCIICANCHNRVHNNEIKIIGVFPSTKLPYSRTLVFEINGVSNVPGITSPYYIPKASSMKVHL
jgi:hypothetical protein